MDQVVFCCQMCRARLNVTGNFEQLIDKPGPSSRPEAHDASKVDESFILLDERRQQGGGSTAGGFAALHCHATNLPGREASHFMSVLWRHSCSSGLRDRPFIRLHA